MVEGRADQTLDTIWRWWFKAESTASLVEGLPHMVQTMRAAEDLRAKPDAQRRAIGDGGLTHSKLLTNLCTVVFDGPSVPVVMAPGLGLQVELLGEVAHDPGGHRTRVLRETPCVLEILEKHDEAQACWARLIAQQLVLVRKPRPMFHSFVRVPLTLQQSALPVMPPYDTRPMTKRVALMAPP